MLIFWMTLSTLKNFYYYFFPFIIHRDIKSFTANYLKTIFTPESANHFEIRYQYYKRIIQRTSVII